MKETLEKLIKSVEDFEEHLYQSTQIILVNSKDFFANVNLDDYPDSVCFICNPHAPKGEAIILKDSEFKRMLYKFCCEHPDRVSRGRKGGVV